MQNSLVTQWIETKENKIAFQLGSIGAGAILIALLAQITIPLSFTPVPITGQTFGVALISLLMGRYKAFSSVALYLCLGLVGLPFFAKAGGATLGYLLGMLAASFVVGSLADRGWTKKFKTALLACFCGSIMVFTFGAMVLQYYVPGENAFLLGVLPFLPGDLIKSSLAALIVSSMHKKLS